MCGSEGGRGVCWDEVGGNCAWMPWQQAGQGRPGDAWSVSHVGLQLCVTHRPASPPLRHFLSSWSEPSHWRAA